MSHLSSDREAVTKLLVVGQAPSKTAGKVRAFDGASGERLARLLGLSLDAFLRNVDTRNLLGRWPGKHGGKYAHRDKGDRFPISAARRRARALQKEIHALRWPVVVLCGRRVADAFGVSAPFLGWERRGAIEVLVVPHPSGCNLWWNDRDNAAEARRALRLAYEHAGNLASEDDAVHCSSPGLNLSDAAS